MKKLLISMASLIISVCMSTCVSAALLSPGLSVLQASVKMEKGGVAGNTVTFSENDFSSLLATSTVNSIKITSLPDENAGTLMIDGAVVSVGEVIPKEKLDKLYFLPSGSGAGASFGFVPAGSDYINDFICVISMSGELDLAPTTQHGELADMSGITVFSVLHGSGDEGEALRFSIVSGASHGTVEITDEQTGAYRYTPDEGFCGKDSFSFCVTDSTGNVSNISTVTVKVAPNDKGIVYSDMESSKHHLAAAVLHQRDIMLGKNGSSSVFSPDGKVTRSEFLIMAMDAAKIKANEGYTDFSDDANFTPYERKYIAAAASLGITIGSDTEKGRCFLPDDAITDKEAALILCRIAALEGLDMVESDVAVSVMANENYDALAVLSSAGVFESETPNAQLSRADAAQMLYALLCFAEK